MTTAIVTWPVASRARVVQAFKPGGNAQAEAPFRTLRDHGWTTAGVRVTRRSGGRLAGNLTIFSALNVEAARLARWGYEKAAASVARAVAVLETGPAFTQLSHLLAGLPDNLARDVIDGSVPDATPAAVTDALRQVARQTESVRVAQCPPATRAEVVAGRVAEVHEGYVVLATLTGAPTAVPRWMAVAAHRDAVGELLALVLDRLSTTSAVVEAVPAIDYEEGSPADTFTPFGRTDPRVHEVSRRDQALLSGEPAPLTVLVPVRIEE